MLSQELFLAIYKRAFEDGVMAALRDERVRTQTATERLIMREDFAIRAWAEYSSIGRAIYQGKD